MTLTKSLKILLISLVTSVLGLVFVMPVSAQDANQENSEETIETIEGSSESESVSYTFIAQSGDSYAEIARKTTQIYGIENSVELSGEQIIFVETNLTIAAGSPLLNVGQEVSVDQDLVREWVDKAVNLSEGELSLWTKYANVADFNTDNVGEARE